MDLVVDCCVDLEVCCCVRIDTPDSDCAYGRSQSSEHHQNEVQACAHFPLDESYGYYLRVECCDFVPLFVSVEARPAWLYAVDVEPACTHPFGALGFAIYRWRQQQSPCQILDYSIDLPMQYYDVVRSGIPVARMKDLQDRSDLFVAYLIDRFLEDRFQDCTNAC